MKVLHIITNLGQGGAEAVLYRLITAAPPEFEHVVGSLMGDGYYGPRLRSAGVDVYTLNNPRGWVTLGSLLKLRRIVAATAPDIVQTWMYHADLVGGLVTRWAGASPVIWGIRNSNLDADKSSLSARIVARTCARLSHWLPAAIVCNSEQAALAHQAMGYRAAKFTVIPNGYDLTRFAPDDASRVRLRNEWSISEEQILLGMVARWDPQKDHENLLKALAQLKAGGISFRCVLVGSGMSHENTTLCGLIQALALQHEIILTGSRDDIPAVLNALDLHLLSSAGEAFPNTVAEAMACGTPCVVTDVGDAALIVGNTGWVVPTKDSVALAQGIETALITLGNKASSGLAQQCRKRIEETFSIHKMLIGYHNLWAEIVNDGRSNK